MFQAPTEWQGHFDLVQESYTLQVLPPELRGSAVRQIASFVAPGGRLLVISRARDAKDEEGQMPWPLMRPGLDAFSQHGLAQVCFEDYFDREEPTVRRFRVEYRKTF